MALQVKRAGADEYGTWVKMLLVGDPGAGKTRTSSTWPDVLYANCEGGMMSVADRQPACVDITSSAQVKELVNVLGQPAKIRENMLGVPVRTLSVDTFDEVARILVKERLDSERKESMAIADWGWLGDQLRNIIRSLRNLDMNVIINVHVKSQEDSETGRTFFKPAVQGAMGDELAAYVDLAFLMVARPVTRVVNGQNVREIARYMQTYPDAQHPWVKDRSGKMPMEFPINFNDDYERLFNLIYADIPGASKALGSVGDATAAPITPAPSKRAAASAKAPPAKVDPVAELQQIAAQTAPKPAPAPAPAPESTPEPAPTPEPEPVVTTPVPQNAEQPEVTPEPVPEQAPEPEGAAAPASDAEAWRVCSGCGGDVGNKDQADLSYIRYKATLCRPCVNERKKAKR